MRRLIIIILGLLFCSSCGVDTNKTTAITILADRTDKDIIMPKAQDVYTLIDHESFPNTGVNIRFQNIGNVDFSPLYQVALPAGSLFDNTLQRKNHVERFYKQIDTLFVSQNAKDFNYQNSSILVPLIRQLQILATSKADYRSVILYSDLFEFSDSFSVYDYDNLQMLKTRPGLVVDKLKSKLNIPELSNVHLYIVYYPKTNSQNRRYQQMLLIFRELFKGSGLQIHIGLEKQPFTH